MHLRITKEQLMRALAAASGPLGTNSTLPILASLRLEARDNLLRLASTNLDQFADVSTACTVTRAGAAAVPGKKFINMVREMSAPEIELELDVKHVLRVRGGSSDFHLKGLDVTEFPPLPALKEPVTVDFTQIALAEMLSLTRFCASTDESRHTLQGVHFKFSGGKIALAATDGRRAAVVTRECGLATPHEFIVPSKAVAELLRLLGDEDNVTLAFTDKQAQFTLGDVSFTSALIEGSFPNYRQVFPERNGGGVELERVGFLNAVRRVAIMAEAGTLHFKDGTLTIQSRPNSKEQDGEALETLLTAPRTELKTCFNLDYLTEPLQHLPADNIQFHSQDELSPAVLYAPDQQWEYVVMPMRLS